MPLKTILWGGFFAGMCIAALWSPIWGIIGYVGHYSVGASRQWWDVPLKPLGLRYSFTLAAFTAVGIALNWGKLRFGRTILCRQEKLLLLFLGVVWLSTMIGPETVGAYTQPGIDHPSVKLTKVLIFVFMLTHVVTDVRNLDRLVWALVLGALILGMQAWSTPLSAFSGGRLETVGGPDFSESNFLAAYMAAMLCLIGGQFLRSGRVGKVICFLAGGFTANAIILTRSRGAMVGLCAGGLIALLSAPKRYRGLITAGLVLGAAGFVYLTDPQFIARSTTILAEEEQRDTSSQSRIVLAKAGFEMWQDHPFGVGAGNFFQSIGNYIPEYPGADAHNTYIRCLTELGIQGLLLLGFLVLNAWLILREVTRRARNLPPPHGTSLLFLGYGMCCALATLAACCLFISLPYNEFLWWFLAMPICMLRTVENLEVDLAVDHVHLDDAVHAPEESLVSCEA